MNQIKLTLTIAAVTSLLAIIIGTPAMAAPKPAPAVVTMPPLVIKPCTTRPLDQGSGNVKVCL